VVLERGLEHGAEVVLVVHQQELLAGHD
jgi:hypothetical protein